MDGPETNDCSLLEAVRSHLTIGSDSECSTSTSAVASPAPSPHRAPPQAGNATGEEEVQARLALRRELSEPFPDYEDISSVDHTFEISYLHAFHLAVQVSLRAGVVDPGIHEPPGLSEQKIRTLDAIKEALANPQLPSLTRQRFIALINMTIRLDDALFSDREFLNARATKNAQRFATIILSYTNWAEAIVKNVYEISINVHDMLNVIANENIPEMVRYQRMLLIVNCHLRNPRPVEQDLLVLFLNLFDEWVYSEFLTRRGAQIPTEDDIYLSRIQLSQSIHAIWGGLASANQNYANYKRMLLILRDELFLPSINALAPRFIRELPVALARYLEQ
ncbi:hypothetical protein N7493_004420 [Penicillium malachiteum]|uniref:Uncharacterized protein n=1 Tax=Penicillium malachiteum TaxID=1324776 RepID=A0AAD6HP32_9EURO|nr:hypothetical protein N7493_004420 [Penicillium malachiteum]